jgi:hypothetical protein
MTLKTQMAADVAAVFLETTEFAETATYTPNGAVSGFSCAVVPNDVDPGFGTTPSGIADRRLCPFFASLAALRAGILGIELAVRDPLRLDTLTFASGAYAGIWIVERFAADGEDGVTLYAHQDVRHQVAGAGVIGASG